MDDELAQLFSDTMTIIAPTEEEKLQTDEWLRYFRYRAIEYFADPANERKHTGRGNRGVNDAAKAACHNHADTSCGAFPKVRSRLSLNPC